MREEYHESRGKEDRVKGAQYNRDKTPYQNPFI